MNDTPNTTQLARAAIAARDRYGWSPEADEALNALRASVAMELPALPEADIGLPWRHNAPDGSIHCSAFTRDQALSIQREAFEAGRASASSAAVGKPVAWRWMPSQVFPQWIYSDDEHRVREAKRMGEGGVQPLYLAATTPSAQALAAPAVDTTFYPVSSEDSV